MKQNEGGVIELKKGSSGFRGYKIGITRTMLIGYQQPSR
jgi:hypothetical protein